MDKRGTLRSLRWAPRIAAANDPTMLALAGDGHASPFGRRFKDGSVEWRITAAGAELFPLDLL